MLKYIDLLTEQGKIIRLASNELGYAFRTSILKRGEMKGIILRAYFDISKREDKNLLKSVAERNKLDRKETQDPPAQNLGTTVNVYGYKKELRYFLVQFIVKVYSKIYHNREKKLSVQKNANMSIIW